MILRTDVVKTRKPAEGHQECTKEFRATREDGPLSRKDKCNDNARFLFGFSFSILLKLNTKCRMGDEVTHSNV